MSENILRKLKVIQPDALIISDPGVFDIAREIVPEIDVHISTQANNTNYGTYNFWYRQGARRVVTARELSMEEIADIRKHIPDDLEIETFVHGAMCISYSGRCLLSNYFTGRDANQGACTHPCRWKYAVMEESRPGEYLPVYENERGTYIFNSKDLCMIEHIPELIAAGIDSFKIEGRMKTALYVAVVARTYRKAIDDYLKDENLYRQNLPYYVNRLPSALTDSLRQASSLANRLMRPRFMTAILMLRSILILALSMDKTVRECTDLNREINSLLAKRLKS